MKNILILGDNRKKKIRDTIAELEPLFRERADLTITDLSEEGETGELSADIAYVFGGDGAILAANRKLFGKQIPIIGVHMGKFGFLAELTPLTINESLEKIFSGNYVISQRMLLTCQLLRAKKIIQKTIGLNDAVVSRTSFSRLISINLYINGKEANTYSCDGLILSTPAGSTAHSLSAGGPILTPDLEAFVITPICPHTLTNRPLVVSSDSKIEMEQVSQSKGVGLTIDGQIHVDLMAGDKIIVEKAEERLQMVNTQARSFYDVLRGKLNWRGQPTYDVN
ncbi:MAG: NAD(+)/NADH kinase [Candidatus Scalindua sp. AMX11]|nr:MAG: NAD(+)/NADH kinase [Candidatus Scalindua sp.]NOG85412.1 NAD(+)/NADH kinase [Planctomycetota bacterium]RZV84006.1 MAG: NAD(+)/NADH kinase [Candidatus Scalindua sp. SCAELEC01]TDE65710.1 MAG: NAD(+)/NADH kinase [Candidatus Scalindua sp. AMX11]GJQ58800.1 MAG: NAD kinase [Candidatus Scalindua sp.]